MRAISVFSSLLVLAAVTASSRAHAADSSWFVCKGVATLGQPGAAQKLHLVVSVLEHRGKALGGRDLEVTIVKGDRVIRGHVAGTQTREVTDAAVPLKASSISGKKRVVYTGTVHLDFARATLVLAGRFDSLYGDSAKPLAEPLAAALTCELLDDLAIAP